MSENFTNFDGTSRKAGPSSKLQLKNAVHTLATLEIFAKSVTPFALSFRLHNYEQVPIVQSKATADRLNLSFAKYFLASLAYVHFF